MAATTRCLNFTILLLANSGKPNKIQYILIINGCSFQEKSKLKNERNYEIIMKFNWFVRVMGCNQSKSFNVTPPPVNVSQGSQIIKNDTRVSPIKNNVLPDTPNGVQILPNKENIQTTIIPEEEPVVISPLNNGNNNDSDSPRTRRKGIPGRGGRSDEETSDAITTVKIEKDAASEQLIRKAIQSNEFLSNLVDDNRMKLVVEVMYPKEIEANSFIIKEGETGSHLYVSATGLFEVIKGENEVVKKFGVGEAFGELALLYNAKRLASVKVLTPAKVWVLDQNVFQKIMKRTALQEQEDNVRFLSSVPLFKELHPTILTKVSDLLKREFYKSGSVIVRQGDKGDKFYIIRAGTVIVSKRVNGEEKEQSFGTLTRGNYFGELALRREEEVRQATITALDSGVECLTLDREAFTKYLGDLEELQNEEKYKVAPTKRVSSEYEYVKLEDLTWIGTLGVGGFGRVELVQYKDNVKLTFALKKLKKIDMVQQQQQDHAYNEKNIMINCNSRFICRLYQTYRDEKYLYFLMEACLGGDVWSLLQKKREFDEATAKFMSACVIEAFEYLHERNYIYRDLKPENLMLDSKGYIKLVDFGFAKYVADGAKTWTFAGTPEYVAPEIILNRGHNKAVDYWALGIFIHELLVGKPPFRGHDHMRTYNLILKGIDYVIFSPKIPKIVQNLIKKLCRPASTERLGCFRDGIKDIKNHRWYLGFNWEALEAGTLPAPLVNTVRDNQDLSNFDRQPPDDDDPPEETSGWDHNF